ncbi:hypothetical protein ABH922_002484 [Rhodococcus sp. 27YEA15]|uniref:hypothetical protein n=1 Tax=Rhodococcus sp. 27YEA15 TaxID=3156259 RepID=UPI003C7D9264
MSEEHDRLLAEFRELAESVMMRIEPMLQSAAGAPSAHGSAVGDDSKEFTGCSWCPVCAVAALVRGENHELLAFLADQVRIVLAALRRFLDEYLGPASSRRGPEPDSTPPGPADSNAAGSSRTGTFVPIAVTVKR